MRLYTFEINDEPRAGAELPRQGRLLDLHAADPALPSRLLELIRAGKPAWKHVADLLNVTSAPAYAFEEVKLLAPIARPGKILCSGINYRSHQEENPNATFPEEPFFFAKMPSAVIGPGAPIRHPKRTRELDYEIEFAVVIGRRMTGAPAGAVMDCVFGYTILHDVSARDVQFKDNQITLAKNFDSFCPLGPCIVTADELPHPENVRLRTYLNGELMQDGSTSDWVFSLPELLSFLSHTMTLEPGDVISTGTPAGVGVFRKPQRFLRPGDVVRLEAEGVGVLENPVIAA
ncbi:MAG: fumarylacetoacetate hydrolase family protein [Verrucomicrobia bacterium]|nr:fumarylacetoacetate hydrolase family protein [Verrucomicrobiota bacterium]